MTKERHRHKWEKKNIFAIRWMPEYIQCKTCRKVSWPGRMKVTKEQKAHGCFGKQD